MIFSNLKLMFFSLVEAHQILFSIWKVFFFFFSGVCSLKDFYRLWCKLLSCCVKRLFTQSLILPMTFKSVGCLLCISLLHYHLFLVKFSYSSTLTRLLFPILYSCSFSIYSLFNFILNIYIFLAL